MLHYDYRAHNANPHGPTGREAAALVGVSRRTLYRWIEEGRLSYPITYDALQGLQKRPRGPQKGVKYGRRASSSLKTSG